MVESSEMNLEKQKCIVGIEVELLVSLINMFEQEMGRFFVYENGATLMSCLKRRIQVQTELIDLMIDDIPLRDSLYYRQTCNNLKLRFNSLENSKLTV